MLTQCPSCLSTLERQIVGNQIISKCKYTCLTIIYVLNPTKLVPQDLLT